MSHQELMKRHKVRSEVSDLNDAEMEVYEAFLELAEGDEHDVDVLSRIWLKVHRERVIASG